MQVLVQRATGFAANLAFPRRCAYCGRILGFARSCRHCEAALCELAIGSSAELMQEHPFGMLTRITACYRYDSVVKRAVQRMKFKGRRNLALPFAEEMETAVRRDFAACAFDFVLPVPSSAAALRHRGYNVPTLIGKSLAARLDLPFQNDILVKEYETRPQHHLSQAARAANLIGAFRVEHGADVRGKTILLVDDLITTGATMEECAKMLRLAGARTICGAAYAAANKPTKPALFAWKKAGR